MAEPRDTPGLPCPECRKRLMLKKQDITGYNRIGNRRGQCNTCNRFNQAVKRQVAARLADLHPDEVEKLRLQVEQDLYPGVIERWIIDEELPR